MFRSLEDLIQDCIAITDNNKKNVDPQEDAEPWTCRVLKTEGRVVNQKPELPFEIMQGLRLPPSVEETHKRLAGLVQKNSHEPFFRLATGTVLYLAAEGNSIRIFVGHTSTLRVRGDGSEATFEISAVYDYQKLLGSGNEEFATRKQEPEDFLSPPERAQAGSVVPVLRFTIQAESEGASTYCLSTEFASRNRQRAWREVDDREAM